MSRKRVRSRGMNIERHKSSDELAGRAQSIDTQIAEKQELGENFDRDISELEAQYEAIENSGIDRKDKIRLLNQLRDEITKGKEEYEEQVSEPVDELEEWQKEVLEEMQAISDELGEQSDTLRGVRLDAGSMDTAAAADAATDKQREIEQIVQQRAGELQSKIEQMNTQRRSIRANRLGGR